MQAWKYTFGYLLPVCVFTGMYLGGIYNFLNLVLVFGLIPVADVLSGLDKQNPTAAEIEALENRLSFKLVLYFYVPVHLLLIGAGCYLFANSQSTVEKIGLVLSVGITTGGLGITIAHELAHKKNLLDQLLAKILLTTVCYLHFYIEHNIGHHKRVATPEDPATARFGESFYRFYPRTLFGSFRSAWELELTRLKSKGWRTYSWHNQMLWGMFLPLSICYVLYSILGMAAVTFFLLQSIVAFTLLEVVNYVEHYGLVRQEITPGKIERVGPQHSWNASEQLTNLLLFKLQRHADHHLHAARQYQLLEHFEKSPQLPTGYSAMVLLALVPPLWHKIMDPKVLALKESLKVTA